MAGISPDLTYPETDASPEGKYLWIMCYETNYVVDLSNFETTTYPGYTQVDISWSKDSQFAWLAKYDTSDKNSEILSIESKEMKSLPISPVSGSYPWWHPIDHILVYPAKDRNAPVFLDASTISFRELLFKDQDSRYKISNLAWNPNWRYAHLYHR